MSRGPAAMHPALKALMLAATLSAAASAAPPSEPPAPARRIVSLAPNLTEILLRLGARDRLAGRSSACREPAELVKDVPVAGDFVTPQLERLARLNPDLIITTDLSDPGMQAKLEAMGWRVQVIPARRMEDIPRAIRRLGALADKAAEADAAARDMESRIAAARANLPEHPPTVYLEIWDDPLTSAGRDSFLTDMIELAGGRNVFAGNPGDYFTASPEAVVSRDPEVMILLDAKDDAGALQRVATRPGWSRLRAVRHGRVRALRDSSSVQQPGWRVMDGVELLRSCLREPEHAP